jgi:thiol:disulfide interchange protein DsbC
MRHMALAHSFGVNGTPAIVLDDGRLLPGYLAPQQLLAVLEAKQ